MQNQHHSLAAMQWTEETLLKGNSILMPVLTKERAEFLYHHAKRRFKRWLVYANCRSRIMEFRNGAIFQILTKEEVRRGYSAKVDLEGKNEIRN